MITGPRLARLPVRAVALLAAAALAGACARQSGPEPEAQSDAIAAADPTPAEIVEAPSLCGGVRTSIYFDEWESELTDAAAADLRAIQERLKPCRIISVRIIGLAGARGDEAANLAVSEARAETLAAFLEAGGWPRGLISLEAHGEDGATSPEGTPMPLRRRADLIIETAAE